MPAFDRLDALLRHFVVSANLFHSGPLCGATEEPALDGKGYLHVINCGLVEVRHDPLPAMHIVEPTLLFYPRPLAHRFIPDPGSDSEFVCATVAFNAGHLNPVVDALPAVLALPLAGMPELQATIDLLSSETAGHLHGRQSTADRLMEVLLIQVLRRVVDAGTMSNGMLAGLAHPRVGKAMVALHDAPAHPWTLDGLAMVAGLSRSRFAGTFKSVIGSTVGDYLCEWRMTLAQALLRRDVPLKQVATEVGYGSAVALSRVFKVRFGVTPREWATADFAALRRERVARALPAAPTVRNASSTGSTRRGAMMSGVREQE